MALTKSVLQPFPTAACLCLLLILACAQSSENATHSPPAQTSGVLGAAMEKNLNEAGEGELELGTVDDAAMLHWAIEHADPQKMSKMAAEARRWTAEELEAKRAELNLFLDTIQPPSEFEVMEALLKVASNVSEPVDRRAGALEALQEVVEAIDNAKDLDKAGGVRTIVDLLSDGEPDVRRGAAWVVGAAAQNNLEVQAQFLNTTCLPLLLGMVKSSNPQEGAKALYAVSALVRDNTEGLKSFYQNGGPSLLEMILSDESGDLRLQKKAVSLLGDLATFQGGRQAPGYAPLATPKVMSAMLRFMSGGDEDTKEKVVRSVQALLANDKRGLNMFREKITELEELAKLEERLEEMGKVGDDKWEEYIGEMNEVIKQVGETVKDEKPAMLGGPKDSKGPNGGPNGDRTKDEL